MKSSSSSSFQQCICKEIQIAQQDTSKVISVAINTIDRAETLEFLSSLLTCDIGEDCSFEGVNEGCPVEGVGEDCPVEGCSVIQLFSSQVFPQSCYALNSTILKIMQVFQISTIDKSCP
eukprot:UN01092